MTPTRTPPTAQLPTSPRIPPVKILWERLPVWSLRLTLGLILLVLSELVMWENPPARSLLEWPILLVLYTGLASIMLDIVVRAQARNPITLVMVAGLYGLANTAIISHNGLQSLFTVSPFPLIIHGMGLQTAAGVYAVLLFVSVLSGKQPNPIQVIAAVAVGVLWGVWVHWYPIQLRVGWGLVPAENAQLTVLIGLVLVGVLLGISPRLRTFREMQLQLLWWEMLIVGIPLFIALLVGMLQNSVPFEGLIIVFVIGGTIIYSLNYQRKSAGSDPSILAEITFAAPNMITYIVLSVVFLAAGTLAYSLVSDMDSTIGVITYILVLAFGFAWLPIAFLLIFWQALREREKLKEKSGI